MAKKGNHAPRTLENGGATYGGVDGQPCGDEQVGAKATNDEVREAIEEAQG